jgi:anti-sigma-K factor RskA
MKEDIITDYLLGQLTDAEKAEFERQLMADASLRQEVEELRTVWKVLQSAEREPDGQMDKAFYWALESEKILSQNNNLQKPPTIISRLKQKRVGVGSIFQIGIITRYAAVVAGIGFAFWAGRQTAPVLVEYRTVAAQNTAINDAKVANNKVPVQSTETNSVTPSIVMQQIASLRKEVKMTQELVILGLLKANSATERLKGLNYVAALDQPKPAVLEALIQTLRSDENLNIRLSTIETLERFRKEAKVRSSLVAQLEQSEEPLEQTALIEALVRMRVKESITAFEKLQQNDKTDQGVKLLARNGVGELIMTTE